MIVMRTGRRWLAVALGWAAVTSSGAGAGSGFLAGWRLEEGSDSHSVALGDIDSDGDIDAYVTEFYAPDILWLNDGSGQFARSPQIFDAGYGSCALLGPLDNNGSLDLFLGRHLSTNRVWLNDGTGTLADTNQSIGSTFSRHGGALGDVDGDLDLDAYVPTNSPSGANELYLNNGAGVFTNSGQVLGSYSSRAVALGNVDNDSDLDAMIGNNGANKLWKNNGAGVFTDSGQTVGTRGTFDVELADLDGDSDLDAWFANGSTSGDPDEVWLNNGLGIFTNSGQLIGNDYSFAVVLFRCDGDNDLDAFVGNNTGQPNRLYLNNGAGVFTDSGQNLGIGGAISAAARDLDGDLDLDLFLANNTQPEQVFLNDGLCQFASNGQILGSNSAEAVALGDIDGDGDRDALVGSYGGITRVFRNDGQGAFTDDDQWLGAGFGSTVTAVRLADFDGDNDLDAWIGLALYAFVGNDDPSDRLWLNDGTGGFTDSGQLLGSEYTMDAAVGDVDGDLDLDIVVANYTSIFSPGTNRLYRNDGTGTFTQDPQALGTGTHRAVALGRLDGDADLDLFEGVSGGPSKVWSNDGSGSFTVSPQALGSANTYAVALGDFNGDGDLDAFLGNSGGNTVWLNNGNGLFTDSGQLLGSADTVAVHLFDADGDGDLDAWATNGDGIAQPSEVWLNNGAGVFTDSGWALATLRSAASAMGNLDQDFDPDVLIASFDGDHQVWVNQLSGPIFSDGFNVGNTNAWSAVVP